ncbi:MAG: 30S ribosomal protein S6 [Oscillospiraceae bacterium]|nr:30S ribosomal protein S6 [Oscillospiraceae bacterium]
MPKIKEKYEAIIVINLTLGEDGIKALINKFSELISTNGVIDNVDEWGKRRLAYEINDQTEGHYILINFTSAPDFPAELDRIFNITDGLLRTLVVTREV